MNRNQSNRYNAFQRVKQFIVNFLAVLTTYTPFGDEITTFDEEMDELDGLIEEQEKDLTGITEDKELAKLNMCRVCFKYGRMGAGWARKANKREELAILRKSFSSMLNAKDVESVAVCKNIRKVLNDNLAALVSYKILAADIVLIDAAIQGFEDITGAPTGAISDREQITSALDVQMDTVDESVEIMADLILYWQETEPDMVQDFMNAKEIDDIGGRLTIVEFTVKKAGAAVYNAEITDTKSLKKASTNYEGVGAIKSVLAGQRPFIINGNGDGSKEVLVKVIRGKKVVLEVNL